MKFGVISSFYKNYFQLIFARYVNAGRQYSSSAALITEAGQNTEKWIKVIDTAFLIVTPIASTVPASIVSYFTYFTTDAGDTAFQLPFLMWYSKLREHFIY